MSVKIGTEELWELMRDEMSLADARYGKFRSSHEGLGVLTEEYHELVDAIRSNALESVRAEALQIAAVAMRIAFAVNDDAFCDRSIP